MDIDQDFKKSAEAGGGRAGKAMLLKYLNGKRLSKGESIKAKCYDCDGMGDSGDCDQVDCPLYPYSPYRQKNDKGDDALPQK